MKTLTDVTKLWTRKTLQPVVAEAVDNLRLSAGIALDPENRYRFALCLFREAILLVMPLGVVVPAAAFKEAFVSLLKGGHVQVAKASTDTSIVPAGEAN